MAETTRRGATGGDAKTASRTTTRIPPSAKSGNGDKAAFDFSKRGDDESIPQLLGRLADQGSHLAQEQAKLVQAEVRASVNEIKQAAGAMAGAAVAGIAGLGVLLMGLSFLLAEFMTLWLATMVVAAATLIGAYALYEGGRQKLQSSTFDIDRTRRTIERAPDAVTGKTKEAPKQ